MPLEDLPTPPPEQDRILIGSGQPQVVKPPHAEREVRTTTLAEQRGLPNNLAQLAPHLKPEDVGRALTLLSNPNNLALPENVGAVLISDVRKGDSVYIRFGQFKVGDTEKGASHTVVVQRAGDTELPRSIMLQAKNPPIHDDELVAMQGNGFALLSRINYATVTDTRVWSFATAPSKQGEKPNTTMLPLFVAIPIPNMPNGVILATRYPQSSLISATSRQLLFPKASVSPQAGIIPA